MAVHSDPRTGPAESGQAQITAANGTTPQTAVDIDDVALYRVETVTIAYDDGATATVDVTMYDDAAGTSAGNVGDTRHVFKNLAPGEVRSVDFGGLRDFEEDVLVQGDGNQDGNIEVTVSGTALVALKDVLGF